MNTEECIRHLEDHLNIGNSTNSYLKKLGVCVKTGRHGISLVSILGEQLYSFPDNLEYTDCIYISNTICDKYDINLLPLTFKDWFKYTDEWIRYKRRATFSIKYNRRLNRSRRRSNGIYSYYIYVHSEEDYSYRKYGNINDVIACNYLYSIALKNLSTYKKIRTIFSYNVI